MIPRHADSDEQIMRCYAAMSALRPHVAESQFLALVREMQADNYRLAFIEQDNEVVAVAGYRISTNFHLGKNLYIDDLSTVERARSTGHGRALLEWLEELAAEAGCDWVHLDSGVHRKQAHKFYFRQGYAIDSYHFTKRQDGASPRKGFDE
jgi:ribosomal protein S18 acetylase RimI-like enzyme